MHFKFTFLKGRKTPAKICICESLKRQKKKHTHTQNPIKYTNQLGQSN